MSSDADVEKYGRRLSIESGALSFHSRARSLASDTWRRPPAESIHSYRSDHSTSHDGDHTSESPSTLSQNFRSSVDTGERDFDSLQPPQSMNEHSWVHLDCEEPGDWVIDHHLPNLITRLNEPPAGFIDSKLPALSTFGKLLCGSRAPVLQPPGDGKRFRISFAEVQRMRIRKLQCQLVRHVVKMRVERHESPGWEEILGQYIKALQDHDYMEDRSKSVRDPFLATGEYNVDNYVLNSNINTELAEAIRVCESSLKSWEFPRHNESQVPGSEDISSQNNNSRKVRSKRMTEPITGTRGRNVAETWYLGFQQRILTAAAGGAFLVGPVWLMVLKGGVYVQLIVTTACVAVFGIWMAYWLEKREDVLASTAAYAAVLVVFIGTNNP